jgi:alanyl-tRNA synthetase
MDMQGSHIRSSFLNYFEKQGHTVVGSSSLVPQNDPTLLFANAGMNQFKDLFLGKEHRAYSRAATSQKCVRAGGKHNDLENVGFTARHHTFFEMLGNFSFGDYFKKDAIHFAWELITKEWKLPKEKLYITVFEKDDEAADIWRKQENVSSDRIYRLGEKDNFWSMGDTGPCGPCSEIYFDRGPEFGDGDFVTNVNAGTDRYMEFWNLVFMQFEKHADGSVTSLPKPSVDTGAGLERVASILQGVPTNYDTDLFRIIMEKTSKLAKIEYSAKSESRFSFRVIADHARATSFLIADGVVPSNEGRGYVLRRIMRRAIRHGSKLGFKGPFFSKVCGFVIDQMRDAYPELERQRVFIEKAVSAEEEQFLKTLERGLGLLDEELSRSGKLLPGKVAFQLYDTFGFPLDLTRTICEERGIAVDESGFDVAMEKQKDDSRKNWKGAGGQTLEAEWLKLADELRDQKRLPEFVGYESGFADGVCLYSKQNKDTWSVCFSKTPFYGESGGQTGDRGRVISADGSFEAEVVDVQKPVPDLIVAELKIKKGALKVGASYRQEVDAKTRALTARNHTATHLLHWALREVLGSHIKQAGSLVTPDLLRFDFNHFQAVTEDELQKIENIINQKIWSGDGVQKRVMKKDEAIEAGAIAFFGEKYGDEVRVISVGDYSVELCGGTHVDQSSDIHLFKVISEGSVAAGVRRIIARTSEGAFEFLNARSQQLRVVQSTVKAMNPEEIPMRLEKMIQVEKDLKKALEKFEGQAQRGVMDRLISEKQPIQGGSLIRGRLDASTDAMKRLRELADQLRSKVPDAVVILGIEDSETKKAFLIAAFGSGAPKKPDANQVVQAGAKKMNGKGGGKPDFAQAGGDGGQALDEAISAACVLVSAGQS